MTKYTNQVNPCIWNSEIVHKLISVISKTYKIDVNKFIITNIEKYEKAGDYLFKALIAIVLSQNTSDKNAIKAFNNLETTLGSITLDKILNIDDDKLKNAIKVAGLVNRRSKTIKELAKILSKDTSFFDRLKKLDTEEARRVLLELPGIGSKTADVFLLIILKKPTFPIDTHINRIMKRLGLASDNDNYDDIRLRVLSYIGNDVEKLKLLHLLLIIHGRSICTARKPLCMQCIISDICCKKIYY